MSHRRPYRRWLCVSAANSTRFRIRLNAAPLHASGGWQSDRLVDWSVRRGDFGLGGLARQRIVGAFVKLPDAIAVEPLFFHFQIRPEQQLRRQLLDGKTDRFRSSRKALVANRAARLAAPARK